MQILPSSQDEDGGLWTGDSCWPPTDITSETSFLLTLGFSHALTLLLWVVSEKILDSIVSWYFVFFSTSSTMRLVQFFRKSSPQVSIFQCIIYYICSYIYILYLSRFSCLGSSCLMVATLLIWPTLLLTRLTSSQPVTLPEMLPRSISPTTHPPLPGLMSSWLLPSTVWIRWGLVYGAYMVITHDLSL